MEKREDEETTRGHEFYLRHLLLLLQAAPLALRGFICRKVTDNKGNLADIIKEKKDTFYTNYREEFYQLFQDDKINDNIDSWDVSLRCIVISVLFLSKSDSQRTEFEAVKCIFDQRKDLDNYVQFASLDYNLFELKWKSLHDAIIELIKDIDTKNEFECKRMIHSYQPGPISISPDLIRNLKKTHDVNMHVTIALQNKVDLEHKKQGPYDQDQPEKLQNVNIKFTERLQDKFVYVDDSAVLTCKLNVSEENVTWKHDYKHFKDSETIKKFKDGCCHWLAISRAKLEDAGLYSCTSCNESTKAYLRVSEKPLTVTEELHVATEVANVKEHMDIVLICKVNHHRSKVTWQHNGEVVNSKRHHISMNDHVHKLTIQKAQFEDEGEYTVDFGTNISRTEVTLKENLNLEHKKQLTDDLYKNWIRGALGLKYLKLGLEDVSRYIVMKHHSELLVQLSSIGITCTKCTTDELLPAHQLDNCPKKSKCICSKHRHMRKYCLNGGFCSKFFDLVLFEHRFYEPLLANTNIQKWTKDAWSVAKCYINSSGYHDKSSEKEIDCAGLLSLFINNTFFERSLNHIEINGETDVFKKARDTRNDILHNANYELSKGQLDDTLDVFISVLEAKDVNGDHPLSYYPGTKQAIANLDALRKNNIDIGIAGDFQKQIKELKEHAMTEIAKKAEEAAKQNNLKLQHLEERLTETEKELQMMQILRSSQTTSRKDKTDSQVVFKLDLHLHVIEQTGETSAQGNLRIFKSMKDYQSGLKMKTDQYTTQTYESVQRLLEHIKTSENCKIADILQVKTTVVVTICCSTCKAIETLLKLINGNKFQHEIAELRKCLEMHKHLKIYDVKASCSSESLENTRKVLSKRAQIKTFSCEKHIGTHCTWYCSDHDEFFCTSCKDLSHRSCIGLKQVMSDRSYRVQKQTLNFMDGIDDIHIYYIIIKNRLINRSDNDANNCDITGMCMLPNGEILHADFQNNKLKKVDHAYKFPSYCDISYTPLDVCYIGSDKAAVSLGLDGIQFVNVSNKMKLEHKVKLEHNCISLACHGELLYVGDGHTIYRYNKDCQHKQVLYTCHGDKKSAMIYRIAVSDDGERIYIPDGCNGLITIDREGNHLSTLTTDVKWFLRDVCVVGDDTVLVADTSGDVYQVDFRGETVLGSVINSQIVLHDVRSTCFDRKNCRLYISCRNENVCFIYQQKKQNT